MSDDRLHILDCDTGVDDAMAIGLLLAEAPQTFVGATAVFGNVDVRRAALNTRSLLELAGRADIPVHLGAASSLDGAFWGSGHRVHGENGVGGVQLPNPTGTAGDGEPAPSYLVRTVRENPGRVVIIAVGPLTNLAIALSMDPGIAELVAEIVIMGGAVRHPGNATPAAEANVWHDPEAADRVLRSGARVRLVPMDATMQQRMTGDEQTELAGSSSRFAQAVAQASEHYLDFYTNVFPGRQCALHDPLVAALALDSALVTSEVTTSIEVQLAPGPARGQTVADLRGLYKGPVHREGHTTSVVLETEAGFSRRLVEALTCLP
ncbi:nucleoside hydrolase [Nesterenkonia populi]|uniref:nucleoside hydrolase n=1 Tax=Nesterenkonia populi TaxID=1591087 RepID=UPI0011BFC3DC|nr:nucleoside hydrolase [Nesterenkonia populi]